MRSSPFADAPFVELLLDRVRQPVRRLGGLSALEDLRLQHAHAVRQTAGRPRAYEVGKALALLLTLNLGPARAVALDVLDVLPLRGCTHTLVELAMRSCGPIGPKEAPMACSEPAIDMLSSSPEKVGRAGMIGERQHTLERDDGGN